MKRANSTKDLKALIKGAARGDKDQIQQLIAPFISDDEKLIECAVTAKLGLITTYDFAFLTDRRIADLEITPLTGNLNVESAFLHKIDAYVLLQPAIPILLRLFMLGLYLVVPLLAISMVFSIGGWVAIALAALAIVICNVLIGIAINPLIKRIILRFKKSGLWLKLTGSATGVLIFADRDKFSVLTKLARSLSDLKRTLDTQAA